MQPGMRAGHRLIIAEVLFMSSCFHRGCVFISIMVMCASFFSSTAAADPGFRHWLTEFSVEAASEGIKSQTYAQAFAGIEEPDPEVIRKANFQPEFTTAIWDYLDTRVNDRSIQTGAVMAQRHADTLTAVEQRFGVDRYLLLAIWSMESAYGAVLERPGLLHYVPQALATLAYADQRRARFARTQLIAALQILQAGDITTEQLHGSWAGAMGHTQFIPTSYLAYAVDMDGNGRRDIWNSIPDALATAANLLAKNGWRSGQPWGFEAKTPANGFRYNGETKTLGQWRQLGFIRPNGKGYPDPNARAELKMLAGAEGPAFLLMRNFFVIKRYNNSDFYALAVGLLTDRLAGKEGMVQNWPRPPGALSIKEKRELQELLQRRGLYTGAIDGDLGTMSQEAVRAFQAQTGLPVTGMATQKELNALRR
jgi:membrane-bound lytic murein transglycosylase B